MKQYDEYISDVRVPLEFYDVMAEDMYITAKLINRGEIETTVINDQDEVVFHEISSPVAWEALVYFAKQILSEDEKIEKHRNIEE